MANFFIRIYQYFKKNRPFFFLVFVASLLCCGYFASRIKLEEDIAKILPKDKATGKVNAVFSNSKFMDKLVLTVSLKDSTMVSPDSLTLFAEDMVAKINTNLAGYINKINYRVDDSLSISLFEKISQHLPVYLDEADYQQIDRLVEPNQVKSTLQLNIRTLTSPAGFALKQMISNDPVGISFIGFKKLQQLQYDENFELYDGYILTRDQKHLLFFIEPAYPPNNTGKNAVLLEGLDKIIDTLVAQAPQLKAEYFGATAVSTGNALQLRKDSIMTQGITVIFLLVFLGLYFRKITAPLIILIPVVFGALFSLAVLYFVQGSVSVIALGTGSVILGIAVNYSLHVFNHYRHTRSMEQTIGDLVFPLTIGGFTTIGGFLCLQFVESEMLKDLGLFAAFSLVGAALSSLVFLPQFIVSKKANTVQNTVSFSWIDRLAAYRPEYNKYLVLFILVFTIVFGFTSGSVGFESDLTQINFMSSKLQAAETNLNRINEYALKSVYVVADANTLDDALLKTEALQPRVIDLQKQGIIKKVSGVSSLIISDSLQRQRINAWNNYWTPEKKSKLLSLLEREGKLAGYKLTAFEPFKDLINKAYDPISGSERENIQKNFLDDYITEKSGQATVVTLVKVAPEKKEDLYAAFNNQAGITVVDKQSLTSRFVEIVQDDFSSIAFMTSILVFTVLLLTYGRIELALVSFIPMAVTWIWILGLMGMFGIKFNIINIVVSALIFGLGDDYSIFIMDGLLKEYKTGRKNLASFKSSIILSAITTVAGLGVLIFARHPALKSIAFVSVTGILSVVMMSQVLIPFFFRLLITNRVQKNLFPWTLWGLCRSVFAFLYFVSGALLLTLVGFVFAKLNPFKKEKSKLVFHRILSGFCWSLMYIMANVKKRVVNPVREDFSKPAVIVCNHQSFLDILSMVMLHPKLILFTNNWVWNSPVFGAVVRMADYFPVEQGVENNVELIGERIKKGYSVVIFPEGTRSVDGNIHRFHKGAFFLAEKLQLDILPVIIHGTGYTMTKGDFLLKNGTITLEILPRIQPADTTYKVGYSSLAKSTGRYFREQYKFVSERSEQPAYFRERLIYNYLYKGPELEWYLKIKLSLEKNYTVFNSLLPRQGQLLDIGCGYGFMCYMLYFISKERQVTGIDYDPEKINTANHCFDKNSVINFYCSDAMEFPFERYDGIIMADMLHYLQPEQQEELVEKCIHYLNPGGIILVREGNTDLGKRHLGTRVTEYFSTRFFKFNKTSPMGLSFLSGTLIRNIATKHHMEYTEIDQAKFTSNIIYSLKKSNQF